MKHIILIPARGGSKRITNKNTKKFLHESLLDYSINFAKQLTNNDNIIVSSDCEQAIKIAKHKNVQFLIRPYSISSDSSSTGEVLKHLLSSNRFTFDSIITLQPTNPFRNLNEIKLAIKLFELKKHDSLVSVSSLDTKFGTVKNETFIPSNYSFGERSQEMNSLYFETGQFYITNRKIASEAKVLSNNPFAFVTNNWFDKIDIDTNEDFELAEALAEIKQTEFNYF